MIVWYEEDGSGICVEQVVVGQQGDISEVVFKYQRDCDGVCCEDGFQGGCEDVSEVECESN